MRANKIVLKIAASAASCTTTQPNAQQSLSGSARLAEPVQSCETWCMRPLCLCAPPPGSPRCRSSSETTALQPLTRSRQTHAHESAPACTCKHMHAGPHARPCLHSSHSCSDESRSMSSSCPAAHTGARGAHLPTAAHRRKAKSAPKNAGKCAQNGGEGGRNGGALSPKLPSAEVQLGLFLGVRKPGWPRITICPSGWFEAGAAAWIARSKGDAPVTESAAQPVSPSSYLI